MAKYNLLVIDPPYGFNDTLSMSKVKRSANNNYATMSQDDLEKLDINSISKDDAVLALWVPSSLISFGLKLMNRWGFKQTQTWIWSKTVKDPFKNLKKDILSLFKDKDSVDIDCILDKINSFDLNCILKMNMGRLFRQSHEIVLVGVKGKVYSSIKNKSQKSVIFDTATKHSVKTEKLQNQLELMFPSFQDKLEVFARRDRKGWTCIGLECPSSLGEDVNNSIKRLLLI